MAWGKQREESHIQCSLIKSPVIYIEPIPRSKIQLLMGEYTNQEWMGYLAGKKSGEDVFVEELVIPPHLSANGGYAEAERPEYDEKSGIYKHHAPKNCVGVIHSHHHMGAFHSGTDQAHVDKNYPISITVAFNGSKELVYDAVSFKVTPCGKATTLKSTVKYVQPDPLFDSDKWLTGAKKNIDKGKIPSNGKETPILARFTHKPTRAYHSLEEYREDWDKTFTMKDGTVLTGKELDDILKDIYKD